MNHLLKSCFQIAIKTEGEDSFSAREFSHLLLQGTKSNRESKMETDVLEVIRALSLTPHFIWTAKL